MDLGKLEFSQSPLRCRLSLVVTPSPDTAAAACSLALPLDSKLASLADCTTDTAGSVQQGVFTAPQSGLYRLTYTGVLKVGTGRMPCV